MNLKGLKNDKINHRLVPCMVAIVYVIINYYDLKFYYLSTY